ncbi:phosphoglucosamine mutase (plasmid) [Halobaculum sp. CBA1158]|uniref:phosphoglucosamine mutase n=1 Tax=Halobaculum sp. CBA1158 TaxID=2904243 RepID=UPI001F3583C4|nr:phosphoglucosamine mutase [Halobaculum sp. CBA1158]UIP01323.1 phosphoglucosamine mutase [Halobaculum sp. CBA1158]
MFGTSGIRGPIGETVTAELALDVGRAVASEGADRVVVGRDTRETGPALVDALSAGLRECGSDVVSLGEVPTPTVARAVEWYDADAGVTVTASHNPASDNGLKLWTDDGAAYVGTRQEGVADRIRQGRYDFVAWDEYGDRTRGRDARTRHVRAVVDAVAAEYVANRDGADRGGGTGAGGDAVDLGLDVVVDAGNGSGRITARALRRLGCSVETIAAEPDGTFPSRPSEPTAENCETLRRVVAATDADLGIAHDGDADRMRAVDGLGEFLAGDTLLALFARDAADAGERVAVPIDTSIAVDTTLEAIGASTTHTRVGDGHVAERTRESDVVFGGEPSGAWIWPDLTRCPDGTLAAAKLAELVARRGPLDRLAAGVETVPLRRTNVETDAKREVVEHVAERVGDRYANVTTVDGVRVDVDAGWFLVRASGTQPLVRVTAEAGVDSEMESLFETATGLVEEAREAVAPAASD